MTHFASSAVSPASPLDASHARRASVAGFRDDDDAREAHSGFSGIILGVCIGLAIWIALALVYWRF